jgi:hypothetical protein
VALLATGADPCVERRAADGSVLGTQHCRLGVVARFASRSDIDVRMKFSAGPNREASLVADVATASRGTNMIAYLTISRRMATVMTGGAFAGGGDLRVVPL